MRTISYNSIRLTLLVFKQRRVALVHGTKMLVLLILAGFSWQSAAANIITTGTRVGNFPAHVLGMKNQAAPPPAGVTYWVTSQLITTPSGADQVRTGEQIQYTVHVQNTTGNPVTGVTIVDTIPANTTYLTGPVGSAPGGIFTYPVTVPSAGLTFSFSVLVGTIPPTVGYIKNTVYVDFGDAVLLPMPATSGTATPPVYPAYAINSPAYNGLSGITWKSQSYTPTGTNGFVQAGDSILYTIWVRNNGDLPLTNIVITDYVPAYTGFVSALDGGTKDADDLITWTIPSLATGQQTTVSFYVRVAQDLTGATSIENTASVDLNNGKAPVLTVSSDATGTEPSSAPQGNNAATTIPIKSITSFETWKVGINDNDNNSPTVGPGEDITYIIYIRNTGNISIPVITVNDIIPTGTTFKRLFDGGAFNPGDDVKTINWEVPNIAAGAVASVRFTVTVDEHLEGLKSITNIARVNKGDTTLETIGCDPAESSCNKSKKGFTMQLAGTRADLFISNVVTPNGDGKNDFFIVRGIKEKYRNSALYVYNRWGNEVYQSKDYQNTWSATGLSEGTYYYVLDLNDNGTIKKYKGWVMIIR